MRHQPPHIVRQTPAEDGSSTVTVVLILPGLLFAMMAIIQFAFWYHASHVALAAAQEGVRAVRVLDGSEDAGRSRTEWMLQQLGPELVLDASVVVARGPDEAHVEVNGFAPQWIPGLRLPVRASATGKIETFRADEP